MRRYLMKVALLFLACACFARPACADGTISGRMSWVAGNVLVYKDSRGLENRIQVDPQAQITQNGRVVLLDQLKWGAFLNIVYVDRPFAPVAIAIDAASRFGCPVDPADDLPGAIDNQINQPFVVLPPSGGRVGE